MKTLLFGTMYLGSFDAMLRARHWARLCTQQNADIWAIDSNSPSWLFKHVVFSSWRSRAIGTFHFSDNIGHLGNPGQRDGWGRAFCKGIEIAIEQGYEWAVHVECDLAFGLDVESVLRVVKSSGKAFAAPWCPQVNGPETGLMFMNVQRLKEIDFVKQYHWETPSLTELPEVRVGNIFGDDYTRLNFNGGRFEYREDGLTPDNIRSLDYFTHIRPWAFEVYDQPLRSYYYE